MVKTIKRTYCMFLIFLAELFSLSTPYCAAKPLDTAEDFPAKVVQQAQNASNQQPADYNINAKQDVSNIEPIKLGSINYEPVCIATPIQNDISGMKAAFSDFGVNVNRYCKQKSYSEYQIGEYTKYVILDAHSQDIRPCSLKNCLKCYRQRLSELLQSRQQMRSPI